MPRPSLLHLGCGASSGVWSSCSSSWGGGQGGGRNTRTTTEDLREGWRGDRHAHTAVSPEQTAGILSPASGHLSCRRQRPRTRLYSTSFPLCTTHLPSSPPLTDSSSSLQPPAPLSHPTSIPELHPYFTHFPSGQCPLMDEYNQFPQCPSFNTLGFPLEGQPCPGFKSQPLLLGHKSSSLMAGGQLLRGRLRPFLFYFPPV